MKTSERGLALIKLFEGFRAQAYLDGGGVWTIGYGHTIDVGPGDVCTQGQAEVWLAEDIQDAETAVNRAVTVPLTQNEFDALVSIVFNVGPGKKGVHSGIVTLKSGEPSTLLRKLNAEDYDGAAFEFRKWDKDNGQVVPGLTRRRLAEQRLFETA